MSYIYLFYAVFSFFERQTRAWQKAQDTLVELNGIMEPFVGVFDHSSIVLWRDAEEKSMLLSNRAGIPQLPNTAH